MSPNNKSLQKDKDHADISSILRELHKVVDQAVETRETPTSDGLGPYDISKIDFDLLRREFERSSRKNTTVQELKDAIENRLATILAKNPLRADFQKRYEEIFF